MIFGIMWRGQKEGCRSHSHNGPESLGPDHHTHASDHGA